MRTSLIVLSVLALAGCATAGEFMENYSRGARMYPNALQPSYSKLQADQNVRDVLNQQRSDYQHQELVLALLRRGY